MKPSFYLPQVLVPILCPFQVFYCRHGWHLHLSMTADGSWVVPGNSDLVVAPKGTVALDIFSPCCDTHINICFH